MPNVHQKNTTTSVPTRYYLGRSGVDPTPLAPWIQRRQALVEKIASRVSLRVNVSHALKTNTREQDSRDLRRAIEEGYVVLSQKPNTGRSTKERPGQVGKQCREVTLSDKGRALLPSPPAAPTLGPYAKRRAALLEARAQKNHVKKKRTWDF